MNYPSKLRYQGSLAVLCTAFTFALLFTFSSTALADPPSSFDLRDYAGQDYVTSVKNQQGGTCWTHGAVAAMESNLLMTNAWTLAGETGEPNLAEYHLDWWNGFNQHNNDDIDPPSGAGLEVHQGGDYRVTSAYLTRGEGAVRDIDGQSYASPPLRDDPGYHYYYARDIEWFVVAEDLSNIDSVKNIIMSDGAIGTCMCYDASFISGTTHYQPPSSMLDPNHAIAIIGWDDTKATQASMPGAWLCKNSWGSSWGESGYFWISYYDKHCGKHPEMGAISFQEVEPMQYDQLYYHDYHGWRDTKADCSEAFNAFTATGCAEGVEAVRAVSFFTAADNVTYTVKIYDDYAGGELQNELASKSGTIVHSGFHTIDLDSPIELTEGDDFYVYVQFSDGGHPYDRTSDVPVLLGADYRTIVESDADPGQSYYRSDSMSPWEDLNEFDSTANFCIKALSTHESYLNINLPDGAPDLMAPGEAVTFTVQISDNLENYVPGSGTLHYRYDGGTYQTASIAPVSGDQYEATLPAAGCGDSPEFYLSAEGVDRSTVYNPPGAPDSAYTAQVGTVLTVFHDNFETDMGWTAVNLGASSGQWERGVPVNDPGWDYDPEADSDGSGSCYLTGNQYGNTDIDDGSVRLTSPSFTMTDGCEISYDYYLYLTNTDGGVDNILVEINNNGGAGVWTEIAVHDTDGGLSWRSHAITAGEIVAAGVTLTSNMAIRFTVGDFDPQSIVEAGIDNFRVSLFECNQTVITGMQILLGAETVVTIDGETVEGSLDIAEGDTSEVYEIWFSSQDKALFQPDPSMYNCLIDIANTETADYEITGDWQFKLIGKQIGQTNLNLELQHFDQMPYSSPDIPVDVTAGYICGDANADGGVNVSDAVHVINYVFIGGTPPNPMESGDCNCDGSCNVSDAVMIINYVFIGGNEPCDTDGNGEPDC